MKWNMGWMHDTLDYISRDPIYRSYHHHEMTFSMLYAFSENFVLPISHDEVVHGKGTLWGRMPGNDHVKAAGLRSLLAYQWAHPGKQLLFMGQEFGQRAEWSEERGLDWCQLDEHGFSNGILRLVADINDIYRSHPALWSQDTMPEGYSWIDANDSANNVLSFLRYGKRRLGDGVRVQLRGRRAQRLPAGPAPAGRWREVLNTDATAYNGSGIGNYGRRRRHRRPVARPAGLGGVGAAAHVGAVAGTRVEGRFSTARWRGCAARRRPRDRRGRRARTTRSAGCAPWCARHRMCAHQRDQTVESARRHPD